MQSRWGHIKLHKTGTWAVNKWICIYKLKMKGSSHFLPHFGTSAILLVCRASEGKVANRRNWNPPPSHTQRTTWERNAYKQSSNIKLSIENWLEIQSRCIHQLRRSRKKPPNHVHPPQVEHRSNYPQAAQPYFGSRISLSEGPKIG